MAKKSSSGCAYTMPMGKPYRSFTNGKTLIKVFYSMHNAEVYQVTENHTQRVVISHCEYDNFESRILTNGFKVA
jgi:hypothetical protein